MNSGVPDLEPGSTYAPQIVTDSSGHAIAVWNQRDAGIRAARYSPGTAWESAVSIVDTQVWNGGSDIAIDQMGNAIVVWSMPDGASPSQGDWLSQRSAWQSHQAATLL